jgi:hypothetical protein
VATAKDRLSRLQELQTRVNATWKGARWIMDLLTFARDRNTPGGVPLRALLPATLGSPGAPPPLPPHAVQVHGGVRQRQHLQPPPAPSPAGSRGSWPPPPALLGEFLLSQIVTLEEKIVRFLVIIHLNFLSSIINYF